MVHRTDRLQQPLIRCLFRKRSGNSNDRQNCAQTDSVDTDENCHRALLERLDSFPAFAAVLTVGAMGWTTTPEASVRAAFIAVAFGLPAIVLFLLAYWLEGIRYNEQFG